MNLQKISEIAAREMKTKASHPFKEPGNKYYHGQRTAEIIRQLCSKLRYTGNIETLTAAAWFHDICNGEEHHEIKGADKTFLLLQGLCSEAELKDILRIISVHDSRTKPSLETDEMIHQDADLLDHFGTFEVWNYFQYALKEKMSMTEAACLLLDDSKFSSSENIIHFEISKKIYQERRNYVKAFAERMLKESKGEIYIP